jgi:hypothetical protein
MEALHPLEICYHAATGTCQAILIHQEDGSFDSSALPWVSSPWVVSGSSESSLLTAGQE